jgi:hypothetical protein
MLEQLIKLLKETEAKQAVLTIKSISDNEASVFIATEFNEIDANDPIQQKLRMPVVAEGYIGSLEAELSEQIYSMSNTPVKTITSQTVETEQTATQTDIDSL